MRPTFASNLVRHDSVILVAVMVVAALSVLPFFYAAGGGLPDAHDLRVHWMRMIEFDQALRSGVWYPRWLGGMNYHYGAATTLFYPPLFYYITSAAHALTAGWAQAIEVAVLLAATGSAMTFYIYSRTLLRPTASAVATLAYVLLPYRLIDLYHRGAIPELITFIWMPLVMMAEGAAAKRLSAISLIGGAIAFCLLILTHPPVAYLFSISLAVLAVAWSWLARSWKPALAATSISVIGSALSAVYCLPAIAEIGYAKQTITEKFPYRNGYITRLIAGERFQVMLAAIIIVTALVLAFFAWLTYARWSACNQMKAWVVVGLVSIFMMMPISDPIAHYLPGIDGVAFPWRWLAITTLATSILAGVAFEESCWRRSAGIARAAASPAVVLIAILAFGMCLCVKASNLKVPLATPDDFVEEDFTPRDAPPIADMPRGISAIMMSGASGSAAWLVRWKPHERVIETFSPSADTLQVFSFMFPGWIALVDEHSVANRAHNRLSTILVDVPPGNHTVKLVFAKTTIRRCGECLSAVTLCLCVLSLTLWAKMKCKHISMP
jgi:uncharacterized membrane protein